MTDEFKRPAGRVYAMTGTRLSVVEFGSKPEMVRLVASLKKKGWESIHVKFQQKKP